MLAAVQHHWRQRTGHHAQAAEILMTEGRLGRLMQCDFVPEEEEEEAAALLG